MVNGLDVQTGNGTMDDQHSKSGHNSDQWQLQNDMDDGASNSSVVDYEVDDDDVDNDDESDQIIDLDAWRTRNPWSVSDANDHTPTVPSHSTTIFTALSLLLIYVLLLKNSLLLSSVNIRLYIIFLYI